jgi:ubiquinone/menaquinone biosynthesis C-methylase UbiE
MKTKLSTENPFGYNRHGFAFEHIQDHMKCLDYGCYDGHFIKKVKEFKNVDFVGVDRNSIIISENPHKLELIHIRDTIPFDNETFDCVTMLDVLEHIHNQALVLEEISRVLKTGGTLIVTVPKKHIFSFLDLKNLGFTFPTLSKCFLCLKYSRQNYNNWYANNPNGLIGDVEKEKSWHQHFTDKLLETLLEGNGFEVEIFDGSCLFQRVFILFDVLKAGFLFPKSVGEWDCQNFEHMNLFCKAVKVEEVRR